MQLRPKETEGFAKRGWWGGATVTTAQMIRQDSIVFDSAKDLDDVTNDEEGRDFDRRLNKL